MSTPPLLGEGGFSISQPRQPGQILIREIANARPID
jgi:hypothetical protein